LIRRTAFSDAVAAALLSLIENFGLETPSFSEAKDGFILP